MDRLPPEVKRRIAWYARLNGDAHSLVRVDKSWTDPAEAVIWEDLIITPETWPDDIDAVLDLSSQPSKGYQILESFRRSPRRRQFVHSLRSEDPSSLYRGSNLPLVADIIQLVASTIVEIELWDIGKLSSQAVGHFCDRMRLLSPIITLKNLCLRSPYSTPWLLAYTMLKAAPNISYLEIGGIIHGEDHNEDHLISRLSKPDAWPVLAKIRYIRIHSFNMIALVADFLQQCPSLERLDLSLYEGDVESALESSFEKIRRNPLIRRLDLRFGRLLAVQNAKQLLDKPGFTGVEELQFRRVTNLRNIFNFVLGAPLPAVRSIVWETMNRDVWVHRKDPRYQSFIPDQSQLFKLCPCLEEVLFDGCPEEDCALTYLIRRDGRHFHGIFCRSWTNEYHTFYNFWYTFPPNFATPFTARRGGARRRATARPSFIQRFMFDDVVFPSSAWYKLLEPARTIASDQWGVDLEEKTPGRGLSLPANVWAALEEAAEKVQEREPPEI